MKQQIVWKSLVVMVSFSFIAGCLVRWNAVLKNDTVRKLDITVLREPDSKKFEFPLDPGKSYTLAAGGFSSPLYGTIVVHDAMSSELLLTVSLNWNFYEHYRDRSRGVGAFLDAYVSHPLFGIPYFRYLIKENGIILGKKH